MKEHVPPLVFVKYAKGSGPQIKKSLGTTPPFQFAWHCVKDFGENQPEVSQFWLIVEKILQVTPESLNLTVSQENMRQISS